LVQGDKIWGWELGSERVWGKWGKGEMGKRGKGEKGKRGKGEKTIDVMGNGRCGVGDEGHTG
jgi:hypothetical protein